VVQALSLPGEPGLSLVPIERAEPLPPTPRLAAIDIGSNSIHMIVVAPEPKGGYRVLDREREMVRLGKNSLLEEPRERSPSGPWPTAWRH